MEQEQQHLDLLNQVTGLGDVTHPTNEDFEEAQRLIDDPEIPCSDLRGQRDLVEPTTGKHELNNDSDQ